MNMILLKLSPGYETLIVLVALGLLYGVVRVAWILFGPKDKDDFNKGKNSK